MKFEVILLLTKNNNLSTFISLNETAVCLCGSVNKEKEER